MTGHTCPHIGCLRPALHDGPCGAPTMRDALTAFVAQHIIAEEPADLYVPSRFDRRSHIGDRA